MAYNRDTALLYLNQEFGDLLVDAGIQPTQDGWKTVLDRAFRSGNTVDAEQEALLDYYALSRLAKAYAGRVSISKSTAGNSVSKQRNQAFAQVKMLLDQAQTQVKDMGLVSGNGWQYGSIELDFIEPDEMAV